MVPVLSRESVSRWRRRRWREVSTDSLPDVLPPSAHESGDDAGRLARLAPRERAVIVQRYYEDLTECETADVLGIAVGTVKSQARDGLSRLRDLLPRLGPTTRRSRRPRPDL